MNFNNLGKNLLYFSLAIIVGLFIGLRILEAHSPQQHQSLRTQRAGFFNNDFDIGLAKRLKNRIVDYFKSPDSLNLSIKNLDVQNALRQTQRKGNPIALLSFVTGYLIDAQGRVLSTTDSSARVDLPVITCSDVKVDLHKRQLRGSLIEQALEFLRLIKKRDKILYDQISEIHLSDRFGILAYLSSPQYLPLIIGRGSLHRKVAALDKFIEEYERKGILNKMKYVDFRIDGQIILKKNS